MITSIKPLFRRIVDLQTLAFLIGTASAVSAQSTVCQVSLDFSSAVTTSPAQASGTWYTDRYAPNGFTSPVNFDGGDRLKLSIAAADAQAPSANPQSGNNTQGRQYDVPTGTVSMDIDVYIPSDWATTNRRMAGLWGVALDASNEISAYPIVEFTSDGANPRFRGFNGYNTVGWLDMGLPTGFTYNSWVHLRIELLPSGEFRYSAGDKEATTTVFSVEPTPAEFSKRFRSVILQGYNTPNTDSPPGVTYDIYWDNFCGGTTGANPTTSDLAVSVALGSTPGCTATLTATGNGTSYVFTGPNGYVFSNVFREFGTHQATASGIKEPGTYTLTVYGPGGDAVTQTVNVTGQACP